LSRSEVIDGPRATAFVVNGRFVKTNGTTSTFAEDFPVRESLGRGKPFLNIMSRPT
jgi:hypothetical protein